MKAKPEEVRAFRALVVAGADFIPFDLVVPNLNMARIEESDSLNSGFSVDDFAYQLPRGPTTLMTAAGLRAATAFDGAPLIFPAWRNPNLVFKWPRPGPHTQLTKVVDWKALVQEKELDPGSPACLCLRCACLLNYLPVGSCKTRYASEDQPLLIRASSNFYTKAKVVGALFEVRYLFLQKDKDLGRLRREQERSSVCFFFTSFQAFELVLRFDEGLQQRFGHGGVVDDRILRLVLHWTLSQNLEAYFPPLLSTEI